MNNHIVRTFSHSGELIEEQRFSTRQEAIQSDLFIWGSALGLSVYKVTVSTIDEGHPETVFIVYEARGIESVTTPTGNAQTMDSLISQSSPVEAHTQAT